MAYLALVAYGSLIPFEYRDRSLEQAIEAFTAIPFLNLGVASRADWIANIVLYIPLAFIGCVWSGGMMRRAGTSHYFAIVLIFLLCMTTAVALEFTQLFFAPRTVSLNDLLAEMLGTLGGVVLWTLGRRRIERVWKAFAQGGRHSVLAAIVVYGLGYVLLALFPYDFVISTKELTWKLASGSNGWLVAGECRDWLRCSARLAGEAMAIGPMGMLIALAAPRITYPRLFLAGITLGVILEALQLLLASGFTQGLSVLLRVAGLLVGAALGHTLRRCGPLPIARILWRGVPLAAIPYLLLLAGLSGWFSSPWLPVEEAFVRLASVKVMPFYYHYFSSEPAAIASLLAQAGMYAPVGLILWARFMVSPAPGGMSLGAALWAAGLALPIELGKLMVAAKHPDLTNLLIAACSAAFTFTLVNWLGRAVVDVPHSDTRDTVPIGPPTPTAALQPGPARLPPSPLGILIGVLALIVTLMGVVRYPLGAAWPAALLLGYGALLWHRPSWWLFAVPALLPVLDLSQFTGRPLLDEFDLLVLTTLAVGYWRIYSL